MQQLGRRLEFLVLDQPPNQRITRIFGVAIVLRLELEPGHQRARLDVYQRGGHHQEVTRDVEVELLHHVEVVEILLGDEHDRDVVDVDFLLPDQQQQQVERTLEVVEPDRILFESRLEIADVVARVGHGSSDRCLLRGSRVAEFQRVPDLLHRLLGDHPRAAGPVQ